MRKKQLRVAVLSGGFSNERAVSLKSGTQIARALPAEKYHVSLIDIKKDGRWLLREKTAGDRLLGAERSHALLDLKSEIGIKSRDLKKFDVVFVGLHGKFGEDGKVQALLDMTGIPYTGSGVLASALGMNKLKSMETVMRAGVLVPPFFPLYTSPHGMAARKELRLYIKKIGSYPVVVKPNESGSSVGISIVRSEKKLSSALRRAFREDRTIIVQKYIKGRELTCGVLGNTGCTELVSLPPIEIVPDGTFFDYRAKYNSAATKEICPAPISPSRTREIQKLAVAIHRIIGCDGLTRSDFILGNDGRLYFLEINTIPGLTEASLCPKEARALGWTFGEFMEKQIELALQRAR